MKYKFSVIIPVYNAEKTIHRCVDSLLSQKYDNAQIILVNDGSKDRSGEICKEYASKYECIVYIEQENAGASSARNAGLAVASGEYITFVDSDDYVLDGYCSMLDRSQDDFVVYSYQTIKKNRTVQFQFSQELLNVDSIEDVVLSVLRNRIAAPWNKRFKRAIIEKNKIRFRPDLVIGEDFIFGLEYMLLSKSCRVDPTARYCVDETGMESITRGGRYDFSQFLHIYDYAFAVAQSCDWNEENKQQLLQQLDYLFCRTAFSCAERCLMPDSQVKLGDCVALFHSQYHGGIRPMNLIHLCMKVCMKYKIVPAYGMVAFLHRITA